MNIYLKFFLIFLSSFFSINLVIGASFNVCSVNFNEPWFEIKDNFSNSLLLVDNSGNVFRMANNPIALAFGDDVIVKNTVGTTVATLTTSGSITSTGYRVSENSQANCNSDGNYCANSDTLENRNYYCDLTGNRAGSCQYSVSSSTTCSDSNYLYCNGLNRYEMQYSCSGSSCSSSPTFLQSCSAPSTSYGSWSCSDSDTRVRTNTEYSASCSPGSCGYSSSLVDEYQNCGGGQVCSSGSCVTPVSGSCGSSTNSCNSGSFRDRSDTSSQYRWYCDGSNGGSTASCSNYKPVNCQGYWDNNYGSCSASCGGGNYDRRYVVTQSAQYGGASCPYSNGYTIDNGGNSCNTGSCCVSYYGQSCSRSNSCGDTNYGTYSCGGSCSASTPSMPSYYGNSCQSSSNSCGMRNSGTLGCSGSCSASTPSNSYCSVNCEGYWGGWGSCSASCGGGQQSRTYYVTQSAQNGGSSCPYSHGAKQYQSCNTQSCNNYGTWVHTSSSIEDSCRPYPRPCNNPCTKGQTCSTWTTNSNKIEYSCQYYSVKEYTCQ